MNRDRMPMQDVDIFSLMASAMSLQPLYGGRVEQRDLPPDPAATERHESSRGLLDRLDHWFWKLEQRALEEKLAASTDIYDLEVRIREIERGTQRWSH
jgi:hypothetical protein